MKTTKLLLIFLLIKCVPALGQTDTIRYFTSDFETVEDQQQWTSQPPDNFRYWKFQEGGNMGYNPDYAHEGNTNAFFYWYNFVPDIRNLVSNPIDLSDAKKPMLTFAHAMFQAFNLDNLKILFRTGSSAPWDTIIRYTTEVDYWAERSINIVDYGTKYLTNGFQFAFSGIARGGHGICIDSVVIEEKDIIPRYVKSLGAKHVAHALIPTGSLDVPVMRTDIKVIGNTNILKLNSIEFTSLSTHDSIFMQSGFELVATYDSVYRHVNGTSLKIGSPVSISDGKIVFEGLNYTLPTGYNAIWLVADVKETAPHNSIADFRIDAGAIDINGSSYPAADISPTGYNIIEQAVFYDSFEGTTTWTLDAVSDFEIDVPQGFTFATSDPDHAYTGSKVLGTDLTDDGWYKLNVPSPNPAYYATTPVIDLLYYTNVKLSFQKWFAFEGSDQGVIEVSVDTGKSWHRIWDSRYDGLAPDNEWIEQVFTTAFDNIANRKPWVKIRFGITISNNVFPYAGFNVDHFAVTGNYLTNDVGIVRLDKPVDECYSPGTDIVKLTVKNFADRPTAASIPVYFSMDGTVAGRVYETIPGPIASGDSVEFEFASTVGFPGPGKYTQFRVGLQAEGDEDPKNNVVYRPVYIQESLAVPDMQNFETGEGYWKVYGSDPTWKCQNPEGSIPEIEGSPTSWILSTLGNYLTNDTSYLESSCYDLVSSTRSVFEMKIWLDSEPFKDGAVVEYTTDDGSTWNVLDTNEYGWNWNWYNGYVQALDTNGWSGISDGKWKTVRQLLPLSLNYEPRVKFRVKWASDENNTYRGMAIDDVRVYPMPPDVGVTKIDSFANRCQNVNPDEVTVTIKNFGLYPMKQNDTIIVGFDLNNEVHAMDTFRLAADLLPGGEVKHTLDTRVDVSPPGNYTLRAFTLIEDDPWFYFGNNDTLTLDFEVYPGPLTSLPDTIQTHLPDTVELTTIYNSEYDYWWNGTGGSNTYNVQDAGWQYLTVTATRGNGCSSYDSTNVELLFYDVGAAELVHPTDNCGFGKHEFPVVTVRNYGTDSITAGQKIAVTYVMNGGLPVSDTLVLEKTLYSGKTIDFTFDKGPLDLSQKGIYNFDVNTTYGGDTVATNDAIFRSIEILGRPAVTLGADLSVPALSHTLDAGTGYESYLWDNAHTNQTRTVTESGTYWVQVYDENMCDNADTVNIWFKIRDIRPAGFASPLSDCSFNPAETVIMRVQNTGTDTVPSGANIAVSYSLDGGATVNGTLTLAQALLPSSVAAYTFAGTVNVGSAADYTFEATATAAGDLRPENNDSTFIVYRYSRPVVDFGLDEVEYIEDVSYVLDAGYSPHYAYQWQDTVTSHQYTARSSGLFHVRATDSRTQCFDRDSVYIYLIYGDVGVTWTDLPESGCSGTFENVTVRVQNLGPSVIGSSAPIYVACDVNGARVTIDTLVRTANFNSGASLDLTLSVDISLGSGSSQVIFYTLYNDDKKPENDSLLISFSALPSPVVDFGDENGYLNTDLPHILNAGAGHKSYLWQDNATGQTYNVTANGTYTVTVTGQNDCQTTKTVQINMQNSIGEAYTATGEVIVYPNPSQGRFSISLDEDSRDDVVVYLYNSLGQVVYMKECAVDQLEQEQIDVQHLSRGIYQLLIKTGTKLYRGSVVIE